MRLLCEADAPRLDALAAPDWAACRIRALARAWGFAEPCPGLSSAVPRFYAGEKDGKAPLQVGFAALEGGFASVYPAGEDADGLAEFLQVTAGEVLSPVRLPLSGYSEERGNVYVHRSFPARELDGAEGGLQAAYELLSQVFPERVNERIYREWYADLSHRVRHGMSEVWTLPGVCSGTLLCSENGVTTVEQLGVLESKRGAGWGSAMLAHLAARRPGTALLVLSRDAVSDRFYEHLGFAQTAEWYYYRSN